MNPNVPVASNSPVQPPVEVSQQQPPVSVEHGSHQHQHQPAASYYAPAGVVTVVGAEQPVNQANKPGVSPVRGVEQYGQPESTGLPPNYKPFGSWGLYIGGNPADGYYTNYYKALSNSVEKQQGEAAVKPSSSVSPPVSTTAALSPMLRQAGTSPFGGGDFYPFAYSTSDFTSARLVEPLQYSSASPLVSPVQAGAQVYGSPVSFESNYPVVSSYAADHYATKKLGVAYGQKEAPAKEAPAAVQQPTKGYQSRVYVYPSVASASPVAPLAASVQHNQPATQQVVAYPVPVGSQIVGSQAGVDGAFSPYGVHAFTRYAVKPALVSHQQDQYGVHSSQQLPAYRQQVYHTYGSAYYPLSYYGYPLNQLHYSHAGSLVPASFGDVHYAPAQGLPVDAAVEKVEGSVEAVKPQ